MIVVRAINGLVDTSQQGVYADSVASIASRMDLPSWLVELRHDSTHNQLPTISVLQAASSQLLSWYVANYWSKQEERIYFLKRFCEICCHIHFADIEDASSSSSVSFSSSSSVSTSSKKGKKKSIESGISGRSSNDTIEKCKEALVLLTGNSYSYIGNYKTPGATNATHEKLMRDLNKLTNQQSILSVSFVTDIFLPTLLSSLFDAPVDIGTVAPSAGDIAEKYTRSAAADNAFPFPLWVYVLGVSTACSPLPAVSGGAAAAANDNAAVLTAGNLEAESVIAGSGEEYPSATKSPLDSVCIPAHNHALITHRLWLFAIDSTNQLSGDGTSSSVTEKRATELSVKIARIRVVVEFIVNQFNLLCLPPMPPQESGAGMPTLYLPLKDVWRAGISESFTETKKLLLRTITRLPASTAAGTGAVVDSLVRQYLQAVLSDLTAIVDLILPPTLAPVQAAVSDEVRAKNNKRAWAAIGADAGASDSDSDSESQRIDQVPQDFESERARLGQLLISSQSASSVWKVQTSYPLVPYGCHTTLCDGDGGCDGTFAVNSMSVIQQNDKNCLLDLVLIKESYGNC